MKTYTTETMNQREIIESNSFNSGFGSSFNSMHSESDKAWCYANHVVSGTKPQTKPIMRDEDGWFTSSEHSDCEDDHEIPSDRDETDSSRNDGDDYGGDDDEDGMKQYPTNRQKRTFRPRFQRQTSIASNASANEKKERKTRNSKSPVKTRDDDMQTTKKCATQQENRTSASVDIKSGVFIRNEPDQHERRKIRRLDLARMKSEEMWGSALESDSDSDQSQNEETTSKTKPLQAQSKQSKKFRKKSYIDGLNEMLSPIRLKQRKHPNQPKQNDDEALYEVESENERSSSPLKSFQALTHGYTKRKTGSKQEQKVKQRELCESESERSSSPSKPSDNSNTRSQQNPKLPESGRSTSVPKIGKQANVHSRDTTQTSQRGRSTSPTKTNGNCKVLLHQCDPKPKADLSRSTDKKCNKYEMVPTGSFRQNRSSATVPSNEPSNCSIPIQSDFQKQKINSNTNGKFSTSSQRRYQSDYKQPPSKTEVTSNDVLTPFNRPSLRSEKKRAQSLDRSENDCEHLSDTRIKVNSTDSAWITGNPLQPDKVRYLSGQLSFTEKKKTSRKLDASLLSLTRSERRSEQETESTILICSKERPADAPPVPNRECSSFHSSMSSSCTTLPSPLSTKSSSSSSGSGPSYKNTVQVKSNNKKFSATKMKEKKNIEGDTTTHALDDIMKSRRFRDSNLDLQKKTKQYLVAVNGSKAKTSTTWR